MLAPAVLCRAARPINRRSILTTAAVAGAGTATVTSGGDAAEGLGVVTTAGSAASAYFTNAFAAAIASHRFWDRQDQDKVPAL